MDNDISEKEQKEQKAHNSVLRLMEKYKNRNQDIFHLIFWFFISLIVFIISLYLIRPFCVICTNGISMQSLSETGAYLKKALTTPSWFLSDYFIWNKRLNREGGLSALLPFIPLFLLIFTYVTGGLVRLALKEAKR
ncbi:MAG: hypothetical protein IJC30_01835 [Alphaproteobacteria bacterium]|nr:hypothetical protein [Alphaproteobacteria bacterium]